MPDFEKVLNALFAALKMVFGENIPSNVRVWIGYVILGVFSLLLLWLVLFVISKLIDLCREKFIPLFYNSEERRRSERRRRFAEHLESEIRQLNLREAWQDYRFTELEAEVEAEGRSRKKSWIPFLSRTQAGLRREKSLSRALEVSEERLILLEGDPGSGKSVALRHVAQKMAARAMRSRNTKSIIPIYINLKAMERRRNEKVDRNLIHNFVIQSLNRANDRDVEEFLEQEFLHGLEEGTWFFLFDSFDELPEVLSSTEADDAVRSYGQAIESFLRGMNKCRGVIASRQFRGPNQLGWPVFNILPLTEKRREVLVKKANLDSTSESKIIGRLDVAEHEMRVWASNPMFLGLLCEHIKRGKSFPEHTHDILDTYLKERLERDEEKLKRKFNLKVKDVRSAAEKIAFCMTAEVNIGLNPARKDILSATEKLRLSLGRNFDVLLDALEYLKLARSENNSSSRETNSFTFSHRRFQEYFATCVVLHEPDRVTPLQLLTNARWRETAVVLCQTQPREVLQSIIDEAESLLVRMTQEVDGLIHDPIGYLNAWLKGDDLAPFQHQTDEPFRWPKNAVPLLSLLQDAFNKNVESLTDGVRNAVGKVVFTATMTGILIDRKIALEVGGVASQLLLEWMLRLAFIDKSQWLKDVAYSQVAKLTTIPADIAKGIREALVKLLAKDNPRRELLIARVYIARLDKASQFLFINKMLCMAISGYFFLLHYVLVLLIFKVLFTALLNDGFFKQWGFMTWNLGAIIILCLGSVPIGTRLALRARSGIERVGADMTPFMMLTMPYMIITMIGVLSVLDHCAMGIFVYVTLWPITARKLALQGAYMRFPVWPFFPLIIGMQLPQIIFRKFISGSSKAREWLVENWLKLAKELLTPVLSIAGIMLLAGFSLWLNGKGESGRLISLLLMLIVVISVFGPMIGIIVKDSRPRRFDKREWKRQMEAINGQVTGEVFAEFLYAYKTLTYKIRFVDFIRTNDLILTNQESEEILTRIAIHAENAVKNPSNSLIGREDYLDDVSKLLE